MHKFSVFSGKKDLHYLLTEHFEVFYALFSIRDNFVPLLKENNLPFLK